MGRRSDIHDVSEKGFTIIELLIVLGIAGLIFLFLFMAVPALQRAGRNNQRKHDAATVLQVVGRHMLNNTADFPTHAELDSALSNNKLTIYDTSNISIQDQATGTVIPKDFGPEIDANKLDIYNYAICDIDPASSSKNGKAISRSADYRDVAALYAIETATGTAGQCQQL